ncbi:hypothetical protein GWK08_02305 [Leptobacterium flavescens]|uniref:Uncharacterized protein n=1 Tax=Leptobacterium flavescens TaxID=472055 RepID=A0A6P0UML0_9FLAO|nr:hypothetical protein [Leptobacterium flavescens]NER12263.1 hypothetical protein [Leptobacterium flavescens]
MMTFLITLVSLLSVNVLLLIFSVNSIDSKSSKKKRKYISMQEKDLLPSVKGDFKDYKKAS